MPIENAAMQGRSVIQWDKDDLQTLGLLKVDCLALGMLSAIRRAFDLINHWRGSAPPLGMRQVPAGDAAVYAMIQRAETTGVFQIESRAQMAMLPRLKPACFYDLVIEVAIVRPGPIQGRWSTSFCAAARAEPVVYPSPEVEAVLGSDAGGAHFPGAGDQGSDGGGRFQPRRGGPAEAPIAAWRRRGTLQQFESRLVEGMVARGYEESFAQRIYQQILVSASTVFRSRTPPVLRCWCTSPPGSNGTIRRPFRRPAQQPADGFMRRPS